MLEDLLNAQTRLNDAEFGLLNAMLTYNLAQMNYRKAVGTLLQEEAVNICRNCNCQLPGQTLNKSATSTANANVPTCQCLEPNQPLGLVTETPVTPQAALVQPSSGGPFSSPVLTPQDPAIQVGPYRTKSVIQVGPNSPQQFGTAVGGN